MELATIFLIWLAITIIDNLTKRKKNRIPPPENPPNFDIPTISGDPNLPGEEVPIFIENHQQTEIRQKISPPRKKKISVQEVREAQEESEIDLNLTPSTVLNTLIISELLDKPKALRRRR